MIGKSGLFLAALLLVVSTVLADQVHFTECPQDDSKPASKCTVHSVDVDPCKEADQNKPCRIKKGNNAGISFNYTANFEGTTLQSRAYWANEVVDLPFMGMETDACQTTKCPVVPGAMQNYHINLPISKGFPARTYNVKWKLWNEKEEECCFIFRLTLHK